jgi:peptidyl-prolyl cis-trans isomerase D
VPFASDIFALDSLAALFYNICVMLTVLRKKKTMKRIMWVLAGVTVFSFVLWNATTGSRGRQRQRYAGTIFGKNVSHEEFLRNLSGVRHQALLTYGDDFEKYSSYLDFEALAWNRLILLYEAGRKRIKATDQEVREKILAIPFFKQGGKFDQKKYDFIVGQIFQTTPREFEQEIRETLKIDKLIAEVTKDTRISETQLFQEYKKQNDRLCVDYLLIAPVDFVDRINLEDKEIQTYYNEHKQTFRRGQTIKLSYLACRFKKIQEGLKPDPEKIEAYYQHIKETLPEEEKKESFSLLSEEQRQKIEEKWLIREAADRAEDKIWEAYDELQENPQDFSALAAKYNLQQGETGFFARNEIVPDVGWSADFNRTAFSLKPGEFSSPQSTQNGYFIIQLKEKRPPYIPELKEVKKTIILILKKERALSRAMKKAQQYLKTIKEQNLSLPEFAEQNQLTVHNSGFFSRTDYIPGLGRAKEFKSIAFNLKVGEIGGVAKTFKGYCIIQLKEKRPAEEKKFAEEKTQFKEKILATKKNAVFKTWFKQLLAEANLQNYLTPSETQ